MAPAFSIQTVLPEYRIGAIWDPEELIRRDAKEFGFWEPSADGRDITPVSHIQEALALAPANGGLYLSLHPSTLEFLPNSGTLEPLLSQNAAFGHLFAREHKAGRALPKTIDFDVADFEAIVYLSRRTTPEIELVPSEKLTGRYGEWNVYTWDLATLLHTDTSPVILPCERFTDISHTLEFQCQSPQGYWSGTVNR